jgi:site-specific recombinase XerD
LHDVTVSREISQAGHRARLSKAPVRLQLSPLVRHAPAQAGYDICTVQELLGHTNVKTTMIYTHVLKKGGKGMCSPLDRP